MLMLVTAIGLLFRIYVKRKNKLVTEKEQMSVQFQQTLLQSKLEIQEETFTYISREIHDNIGQTLSMARINLNSLEDPAMQQKIDLIDNMLEKSLVDLRSLSHSLDTDRIRKFGWLHEVSELLTNMERSGKYKVHIDNDVVLPTPAGQKPIILYRMIQEILNNIMKHSAASLIEFKASHADDNIIIEIRDNGKGFDPAKTSNGSGLNNLENRASMIDSKIKFNSKPGQGTSVTIFVRDEPHE
jgi:signal transduction histidine kinase